MTNETRRVCPVICPECHGRGKTWQEFSYQDDGRTVLTAKLDLCPQCKGDEVVFMVTTCGRQE